MQIIIVKSPSVFPNPAAHRGLGAVSFPGRSVPFGARPGNLAASNIPAPTASIPTSTLPGLTDSGYQMPWMKRRGHQAPSSYPQYWTGQEQGQNAGSGYDSSYEPQWMAALGLSPNVVSGYQAAHPNASQVSNDLTGGQQPFMFFRRRSVFPHPAAYSGLGATTSTSTHHHGHHGKSSSTGTSSSTSTSGKKHHRLRSKQQYGQSDQDSGYGADSGYGYGSESGYGYGSGYGYNPSIPQVASSLTDGSGSGTSTGTGTTAATTSDTTGTSVSDGTTFGISNSTLMIGGAVLIGAVLLFRGKK